MADAALIWEIDRLREQGYEPFLVAFENGKGHVRTVSTLDTAELRRLLVDLAEAASQEIETEPRLGN